MIICIIRIVLLSAFIYWTGYFSFEIAKTMFDTSEVIKVDGILNIAGMYGTFLTSVYLLIWWINQWVAMPFRIGDLNKVVITILLVITPLITVGTYAKIRSNIEFYVECKNERKISSRYSSRTYAVNEALCSDLSQHD